MEPVATKPTELVFGMISILKALRVFFGNSLFELAESFCDANRQSVVKCPSRTASGMSAFQSHGERFISTIPILPDSPLPEITSVPLIRSIAFSFNPGRYSMPQSLHVPKRFLMSEICLVWKDPRGFSMSDPFCSQPI